MSPLINGGVTFLNDVSRLHVTDHHPLKLPPQRLLKFVKIYLSKDDTGFFKTTLMVENVAGTKSRGY